MSTTPTTPQWMQDAVRAITDYIEFVWPKAQRTVGEVQDALTAIIAKHAPSPAAQPSDEAKLREVIEKAVYATPYDATEEDFAQLTDRILTALAPHLSQREPGDSELLDWLETTRRALFTRDSSGVVKFDAETSATDWHCVNAPTFRQAIKSAQRGEGKP